MQSDDRTERSLNRFVLASILIHALLFVLYPAWLQDMLSGSSIERGGVVQVVAVSSQPTTQAAAPRAQQEARPPSEHRPRPQPPPQTEPEPVPQPPAESAPQAETRPEPERSPEPTRPEPQPAPAVIEEPLDTAPRPEPEPAPQVEQVPVPEPAVAPEPETLQPEVITDAPPEPDPVPADILASESAPSRIAVPTPVPEPQRPEPTPPRAAPTPSPEQREPLDLEVPRPRAPQPTPAETLRPVNENTGEPQVGPPTPEAAAPPQPAATPDPVEDEDPEAALAGTEGDSAGLEEEGEAEESVPAPLGSEMVNFGGDLIYPKTAQDRGFTGTVVLEATVDGQRGEARDVRIVAGSGYESLDDVARLYVTHRARFETEASDYVVRIEIVFNRTDGPDGRTEYDVDIRVHDQIEFLH